MSKGERLRRPAQTAGGCIRREVQNQRVAINDEVVVAKMAVYVALFYGICAWVWKAGSIVKSFRIFLLDLIDPEPLAASGARPRALHPWDVRVYIPCARKHGDRAKTAAARSREDHADRADSNAACALSASCCGPDVAMEPVLAGAAQAF